MLDISNSALNGLDTVSSVLNSSTSVLNTATVSSQAQTSATAAANKARADQSDAQKLFNEARPSIEKVTAMIACGATESQMRLYMDPDHTLFTSPIWSMSYHKGGCLDIARIDGIKKRAANAVKFVVTYVSPQSQEASKKEYVAIKQASGEWLFNFF